MNFWERLDRDSIFKYFSYKVFEIYTKLQDNFSQISLFFLLIIVLENFDNCYYRRDRVWEKKNSVEFNQFRPSYRLFRIRGAFRARKFRSERNGTRVSRSVAGSNFIERHANRNLSNRGGWMRVLLGKISNRFAITLSSSFLSSFSFFL